MFVSVCLSVCLFSLVYAWLFFSLAICPSVYLSLCLSVNPSVYMSACLSSCLSLFLCLSAFVSVFVCLPTRLCVCPSVSSFGSLTFGRKQKTNRHLFNKHLKKSFVNKKSNSCISWLLWHCVGKMSVGQIVCGPKTWYNLSFAIFLNALIIIG